MEMLNCIGRSSAFNQYTQYNQTRREQKTVEMAAISTFLITFFLKINSVLRGYYSPLYQRFYPNFCGRYSVYHCLAKKARFRTENTTYLMCFNLNNLYFVT